MGAWATWSNWCHAKWWIAPASCLQNKTAELRKVMAMTQSEISTFGSGGFDKGVESSKSNLKTNLWHNKPAGTDGQWQCYLCYSGEGAVAGHEWCWPGLPRRHGPHWTWICGDPSVHPISMNPCLRGGIERAIPQQSKTGVVWFKALEFWKGSRSLTTKSARNIMCLQTQGLKQCLCHFQLVCIPSSFVQNKWCPCCLRKKHGKILSSTLAALVETKSV